MIFLTISAFHEMDEMEGFKYILLLFLVIAMIFSEPTKSCECSGLGDPCRKTYLGKRFCYVVDQNACDDAQEYEDIFYSYSACADEVDVPVDHADFALGTISPTFARS